MKGILSVGCAALALGAFAAADDVLVSFSTPGPDTYADGTAVLDGERYALVWTASASEAFAMSGDGTVTGGRLVISAPLAKDGRCPPVVFEVDRAEYDARGYASGVFSVYLLDTRVTKTTLASDADGSPSAVNAVAAAMAPASASGQGNAFAATTKVDGASVAVASEIASPVISSMRVADGRVTITVDGVSAAATYKVLAGTDVKSLMTEVAEVPADGEATFEAPAGGSFFKVKGQRNFWKE